jgi:hypothetical protein
LAACLLRSALRRKARVGIGWAPLFMEARARFGASPGGAHFLAHQTRGGCGQAPVAAPRRLIQLLIVPKKP